MSVDNLAFLNHRRKEDTTGYYKKYLLSVHPAIAINSSF